MSRRAHRAPFAVTSGGELLLNLAMFDVAKSLDVLLAVARRNEGDVFLGVVMSPPEVAFVLSELRHAVRDASSWVVGGRQRKKTTRRRKDDGGSGPTSSRRRPSSP